MNIRSNKEQLKNSGKEVPCFRHQRKITVNLNDEDNKLPQELEEMDKEVQCTGHQRKIEVNVNERNNKLPKKF